jgi:hypothetical protein
VTGFARKISGPGGGGGEGAAAGDGGGSSSSKRRPILPYGGAKSDGLLNKHAFISCNIIAAAERKKREPPLSAPMAAGGVPPPPLYSRSSTAELHPLEKVIARNKRRLSSSPHLDQVLIFFFSFSIFAIQNSKQEQLL